MSEKKLTGTNEDIRAREDISGFREQVRELIEKFPEIPEHFKGIIEATSDEEWRHESVSIAVYDDDRHSFNILGGGNRPMFDLIRYYSEPDENGNEYTSWHIW